MATIRYLGLAPADIPFFGKATRKMYRVSAKSPLIEVDDPDVDGLLQMMAGGKRIFEITNVPVTKIHVTGEKDVGDVGPVDITEPVDATPVSVTEPVDATPVDATPVDATPVSVTEPVDVSPVDITEPFDFTVLSGIGDMRNQAIHDAGITTPQAFIGLTDEQAESIIGSSGNALASWKQVLSSLSG